MKEYYEKMKPLFQIHELTNSIQLFGFLGIFLLYISIDQLTPIHKHVDDFPYRSKHFKSRIGSIAKCNFFDSVLVCAVVVVFTIRKFRHEKIR